MNERQVRQELIEMEERERMAAGQNWQARAEAAEAALADARSEYLRSNVEQQTKHLSELNEVAGNAQRQLHELSVKYTVALDRNHQMREALEELLAHANYIGVAPYHQEKARAALGPQEEA